MAAQPPVVLARLSKEGAKAYAAFIVYAHLGPSRSLTRARDALQDGGQSGTEKGPVIQQLKKWSVRHRWVARAKRHDEAMAAVQAKEIEHVVRRDARHLAAERVALADKLRDLAGLLVIKVEQMLQCPTIDVHRTEKYEDGREKAVTLKAARWGFGDTARMTQAYAELCDVAMALDAVEPGLSQEQVHEFARRLVDLVGEHLPDAKSKVPVLAGIQRIMEDMGWAERNAPSAASTKRSRRARSG